jgi:hypothetical protein
VPSDAQPGQSSQSPRIRLGKAQGVIIECAGRDEGKRQLTAIHSNNTQHDEDVGDLATTRFVVILDAGWNREGGRKGRDSSRRDGNSWRTRGCGGIAV